MRFDHMRMATPVFTPELLWLFRKSIVFAGQMLPVRSKTSPSNELDTSSRAEFFACFCRLLGLGKPAF